MLEKLQIERRIPYPLLECGGIYADAGDQVITSPIIAKKLVHDWPKHLESLGPMEKRKLSGGHYELIKASAVIAANNEAVAKKPKPTPREPTAESVDKSMKSPGTSRASKKTKTKRK